MGGVGGPPAARGSVLLSHDHGCRASRVAQAGRLYEPPGRDAGRRGPPEGHRRSTQPFLGEPAVRAEAWRPLPFPFTHTCTEMYSMLYMQYVYRIQDLLKPYLQSLMSIRPSPPPPPHAYFSTSMTTRAAGAGCPTPPTPRLSLRVRCGMARQQRACAYWLPPATILIVPRHASPRHTHARTRPPPPPPHPANPASHLTSCGTRRAPCLPSPSPA